jgi:hypothetical protein
VWIDLSPRGDSAYFKRYVATRQLTERIKTYWIIDQSDTEQLEKIVVAEFDAHLDLAIDDASHLYESTKASFETLFPLLRPGGLYIIEDWAWAHWGELHSLLQPRATEKALTQLIFEVVEATGSSTELIASTNLLQRFAAIERGNIGPEELVDFMLRDHIVRRPRVTRLLQHVGTLKILVKHSKDS